MRATSDRVRDLLNTAEIDGMHVRIPTRLDRGDYVAVDQALQAIGGKWNRKARAHVFTVDPGPAVAGLLAGGAVPAPTRTAEGYVRTPEPIADMVCRYPYANLAGGGGVRVLEPSAGDGAMVRAILGVCPDAQVVAVEPNTARAAGLGDDPRVTVCGGTFEEYAAGAAGDGVLFDAAIMNPPFSVPGNRTIWVDHVWLAWSLLKPGGRLVAIVPGGYAFRTDRKHKGVRELIEAHGGADELPAGAFKASGTDIRAMVVWADKPADGGGVAAPPCVTAGGRPAPRESVPADVVPVVPVVPVVESYEGPAEVRRLSTAETARLVRTALRAAFPAVKFSVRSSSYSMGSSVDVSWTDGPLSAAVDEVVRAYAGAGFDAMQDMKTCRGPVQITDGRGRVQRVRLGADFVHTHRRISAELVARFVPLACRVARVDSLDGCSWGWGDLASEYGVFPGGTGRELAEWLARVVDSSELDAAPVSVSAPVPPAPVDPWADLLAARG